MVHGCMVYTELAPRWLQFHVAPAMPVLKYTTSVDIKKRKEEKKKKKKKALQKASHSCRTTGERSESAQESGE